MDTKSMQRNIDYMKPLLAVGKVEWSAIAKSIQPPIDERLLFRAWDRVFECWLAIRSILKSGKASFRPPHGWRKKRSASEQDLFRSFTFHDLEGLYFLTLIEFCRSSKTEGIERFKFFLDQLMDEQFETDARELLAPLLDLVDDGENDPSSVIQKRLDRARKSTIKKGFSHVRVDFITGRIRLCPIPQELDERAALTSNQQPGLDSVHPDSSHFREWTMRFGKRVYFEFALDQRFAKLRKSEDPANNRRVTRIANPSAPKHGIVVLPGYSDILVSSGNLAKQ